MGVGRRQRASVDRFVDRTPHNRVPEWPASGVDGEVEDVGRGVDEYLLMTSFGSRAIWAESVELQGDSAGGGRVGGVGGVVGREHRPGVGRLNECVFGDVSLPGPVIVRVSGEYKA